MHKIIELRVDPQTASQRNLLERHVAEQLSCKQKEVRAMRVVKRSIDARGRKVKVNLRVEAWINEEMTVDPQPPLHYPDVSHAPAVVVVGAGPAGLFAALRLIELGKRPIVLERGKDVHSRRKDIAAISRTHTVDAESNYSFGEGGAGAYSDGKLYTRSKKRGNVEHILRVFCRFGASQDILVDAHPHIGTDKLPKVIEGMRRQIIESGGEVHFQTRVDALLFQDLSVVGVRTSEGDEYQGPVILATGHSARDVYRYLYQQHVDIEGKALAVGVRLEHPSEMIDRIQYHSAEGRGKYLPAAEYSYVEQAEGRGVYSFCMCPGGFIVPAASGPEQIVVNGMSPSNRGGRWSNSGMVVETRMEDLEGELLPFMEEALSDTDFEATHADFHSPENPLRMMYFQEALEKTCWQQGMRRQTAPAQRMTDFVNRRLSAELPASSYAPGLIASPLHFWMPEFVTRRLTTAFKAFGRKSHGFLTAEANMVGVETRTSAPIRILRDRERLHHITYKGLYPCGEGAGYAGGIVSAAIDGERCAEALVAE